MIIKTILSKQDPAKVARAQKLEVRELEEFGVTGNFIAFVDEGAESYDVNIEIEGNNVNDHSCDCKTKDTYCVHQLAVILALSSGKDSKKPSSKAAKVPAKKKLKESEQLLLDADSLEVKKWLTELFKTNKDVELQFLLRFSKKAIEYQPKDITKLMDDGVAAVIGKRKKIDASEVKKVVDIWEKSLIPVWEYIQLNCTSKEIFKLYDALLDRLYKFPYKYQYSGVRVKNFKTGCCEKMSLVLSSIVSDLQWIPVFEGLFSELWHDGYMHLGRLSLLQSMYSYISPQRKRMMATKIHAQLEILVDDNVVFPVELDDFFLDVMLDSGDFINIYFYFQPKKWENKYNLKLIEALKDIEPGMAVHFCGEMINANVNMEYNLPYLNILEELFTMQNNLEGLAMVKMDKFNYNPNVADFEFIMTHLDDEQGKRRFKTNLMTSYRSSLERPAYADLYFGVLIYDKNWKKMLEVIDYNIGPYALLRYWDYMYSFDKLKFAKAIANHFHIQYNTNMEEVNALVEKLVANYDVETLRLLFQPKNYATHVVTLQRLLYARLGL